MDFKLRIAVYAVIQNDGKIAAVSDSINHHFLPGGGIEGDENPDEAVLREMLEACGRNAEIERFIGSAQYTIYLARYDGQNLIRGIKLVLTDK